MKKILLAAICIIGFQSLSTAQEGTSSEDFVISESRNFYVSFGAAFNGDYRINDKLNAVGMPQLSESMPEITFGYNFTAEKYLIDLEFNAGYQNIKKGEGRTSTTTGGIKLRGHYLPVNKPSVFLSVGADLSYVTNTVDLYNRYNVIDLNNPDPLDYVGHINLNNELLYLGPSISVGLFQNKSFPIRLNAGYEWALTNGYWDSDFADVYNSVKESGHNRFYAKLTLYL